VITGAAFCPHPPVLIPELARGAAGELADLRSACRTAILRVAAPGTRFVVLGSGAADQRYDGGARGTLAGFGVGVEAALGRLRPVGEDPAPQLPLSLTVGAWLLRDALQADHDAVGWSVGPDGELPPEDAAGGAPWDDAPCALLVMGDGSARRSAAAPGYLDERAEAFDQSVLDALAHGDPAGLRVDPALGRELLAAGAPAWRVAARWLRERSWSAELHYEAAPYGVGYAVASWVADG
jgi:hypothetical protein